MAPTLLTIVRRALAGEAKLPRGAKLLVAVSGGPDSMALLHALARLAPKVGVTIDAHGIDHGMRPAAAQELDRAAELAASLGVTFGRTSVDVTGGGNLHARARTARYAALGRAARAAGATAIATAHHADDRAETFVMRLLRGAGPRGLGVLPARAPLTDAVDLELIRPMLRARRADVIAHLTRHQVAFATDPSNTDPRFLRARVRAEVMPLLERLDPRIVHHLEAVADELAGRPAGARGLPRATEEAIGALLRGGSPSARVWLPGGLIVSAAGANEPLSPKKSAEIKPRRPRKSTD